jgi:hypothetical protein
VICSGSPRTVKRIQCHHVALVQGSSTSSGRLASKPVWLAEGTQLRDLARVPPSGCTCSRCRPGIRCKGLRRWPACRVFRSQAPKLLWSNPNLPNARDFRSLTVKRVEAEKGPRVSDEARARIQKALEMGGAQFISENGGGPGVRLRRRHDQEKCRKRKTLIKRPALFIVSRQRGRRELLSQQHRMALLFTYT